MPYRPGTVETPESSTATPTPLPVIGCLAASFCVHTSRAPMAFSIVYSEPGSAVAAFLPVSALATLSATGSPQVVPGAFFGVGVVLDGVA